MSNSVRDVPQAVVDALALWGQAAQIRMVQEECAELIAAINRYDRGRCSVDDLASEVADVIITVNTLRHLLGPIVDAHVEQKLARLQARIAAAPRPSPEPTR